MIVYICPGTPDTLSGGTRKLYDHVAILQNHGFAAELIYTDDAAGYGWADGDLAIMPEVYGDLIRTLLPAGVRRVAFVQNSYLIDEVDGVTIVLDPAGNHPYRTTPELVAVMCESAHSEDRLLERFPDHPWPLIRTHSSGNGRLGKDAGFRYGAWPRARRVVYFGYKHEHLNAAVLDGLHLPPDWWTQSMTGMTDAEIADTLATSAIFMATNQIEGMCAPTSEAAIAGAVIVCWTGGGPDEYLVGRAVIAPQDDIDALREAVTRTAYDIDAHGEVWARDTSLWSQEFQRTYSRELEVTEICQIMGELHG